MSLHKPGRKICHCVPLSNNKDLYRFSSNHAFKFELRSTLFLQQSQLKNLWQKHYGESTLQLKYRCNNNPGESLGSSPQAREKILLKGRVLSPHRGTTRSVFCLWLVKRKERVCPPNSLRFNPCFCYQINTKPSAGREEAFLSQWILSSCCP